VIGDPNLKFTKVGFVAGAPGPMPQIRMLQRDDVEVLVGGETREWETVEYVRDAVTQGRHKAMILMGHNISEEAGAEVCAECGYANSSKASQSNSCPPTSPIGRRKSTDQVP
jgi:hypothetical protein